jgi:hypothetical protein
MKLRPTGSLLVCVTAAGIAVGALTLEPATSDPPAGAVPVTLVRTLEESCGSRFA